MSSRSSGAERTESPPPTDAALVSTQRRIEGTFYVCLLPLLFLAGRLVQLQLMPAPAASTLTTPETFNVREVVASRRGEILAVDGTALAVTVDQYDVCANPRAVQDKKKMARLIAGAIGGDEAEYLRLLNRTTNPDGKKNFFVRLVRQVEADRIARLRAVMKPVSGKKESRRTRALRAKFWEAISLPPSPHRQYPLGNFASQLIGFTTRDGNGVDGLERAWNKDLSGQPGEVVSQVDARGRPVPGFVRDWRAPVAGHTLVTTIDPQIQANTDAVMEGLRRDFRPNFATAIVMRPRTGEIVAMTTAPSFDLNKRPHDIVNLATNRCTQFAYEPGSTFKIITAAAVVETVPDWRNHAFYCNGVQQVGSRPMRCWVNSTAQRRHGEEDLSRSIRDSCNFGVYGFARLVGAPKMLEYARRFGLGQTTEIAGLREQPGFLSSDPAAWGDRQLATFSFGQGMTMTPLQLVRVAATIANDGMMMKPLLVKKVRDASGKTVQEFGPQEDHRVVQPETARLVTAMMERVTREGTAKKYIFVPGYSTAGKTGSAQKAIGRKGYAEGKFISSFVGFVPSRRPEFVILVMADEPHGSHWGSEVCGPAFAKIAEKAMLRLRLRQGTNAPAPVAALMQRPKAGAGSQGAGARRH